MGTRPVYVICDQCKEDTYVCPLTLATLHYIYLKQLLEEQE